MNLARPRFALPMQVAAVCYRLRVDASHNLDPNAARERERNNCRNDVEFLLVQTSGSRRKWTFPKGDPSPRLSNSEAAAREARQEAGAIGRVERRHFHQYVHSKAVASQPDGVREFVVRTFLLEVRRTKAPQEFLRNPTWFSSADARRVLSQGRQAKYREEIAKVVDLALARLQTSRATSTVAK